MKETTSVHERHTISTQGVCASCRDGAQVVYVTELVWVCTMNNMASVHKGHNKHSRCSLCASRAWRYVCQWQDERVTQHEVTMMSPNVHDGMFRLVFYVSFCFLQHQFQPEACPDQWLWKCLTWICCLLGTRLTAGHRLGTCLWWVKPC
jgi:hypothetical protein